MMVDGSTLIERQDKLPHAIGAMRAAIAAADRIAARDHAALAIDAMDWPRPLTVDTLELLDVGTEALLFAGEADQARRTADATEDRRLDAGGAYSLMARSRVRIADGHGAAAVEDWSGSPPSPPASATCSSKPGRGCWARQRSSRRVPPRMRSTRRVRCSRR